MGGRSRTAVTAAAAAAAVAAAVDCRVYRCRDETRRSLAARAVEPVERVSIPVT